MSINMSRLSAVWLVDLSLILIYWSPLSWCIPTPRWLTCIYIIYGLADGNVLKARLLYIERFSAGNVFDRKILETFTDVFLKKAHWNTVEGHEDLWLQKQYNCNRMCWTWWRKFLVVLQDKLQILIVSHWTVWKISKDNLLYLYHIQQV